MKLKKIALALGIIILSVAIFHRSHLFAMLEMLQSSQTIAEQWNRVPELAKKYDKGDGVTQNIPLAKKLKAIYQKAEQIAPWPTEVSAQSMLYTFGGFKESAATQWNTVFFLADRYRKGIGILQNSELAKDLLEATAMQTENRKTQEAAKIILQKMSALTPEGK